MHNNSDINSIKNVIGTAYLAAFPSFATGARFHMASRLYLWYRQPVYKKLLQQIRQEWATGEYTSPLDKLQHLATKKTTGIRPRNSLHLRQPSLDKYPMLDIYNPVLSRIHFLSTIYDEDYSSYFFQLFPENDVRRLVDDLLNDEHALMRLSTYAINFLYFLHNDIIHEPVFASKLLAIAKQHTPDSDPELIQLSIYFYTHCILGESRFYYRNIPEDALPTYRQMLHECEQLIADNFSNVHLDNKLEFLVCARILHTATRLESSIYEEVLQSLAPDGPFLIDRVNNFPQKNRRDIETSEHRNILFLMSLSDYSPIILS